MYPFRIFVSYSHSDYEKAQQVVDILKGLGLTPVWDKHIRPGAAFTDAIKELIAHSHIFVPLITEHSQERPWVHQETGYAMALNIPVLPIAIGNLPGEMISQLQAISAKPDLCDLAEQLNGINFEQMLAAPGSKTQNSVEVADWPEKRTELTVEAARRVIELATHSPAQQPYSEVRQRAALSSFCIPDVSEDDPLWDQRYSTRQRSKYYYSWLRQERQTLELHARARGCYLMLSPNVDYGNRKPEATKVRLTILLEFLQSMPDDKVQVVFTTRAREGNMTILGDWVVSEAMVMRSGEGYRQTVFNWHAPTVMARLRSFDREFAEFYRQSGLEPGASRQAALAEIEKLLAS